MRLRIFFILLILLSITAGVSAAPFQAPEGFVELDANVITDNRMLYSPSSIRYYADYVSVETIMVWPEIGDDKYVSSTVFLKPREQLRRDVRVSILKADGSVLGSTYKNPWRSMSDPIYKVFGGQLYEKVMQTIAAANLKPQPTPVFLGAEIQMFHFLPGASHLNFDPASIKVIDNFVSVDVFVVYESPFEGAKYRKRTVRLRPGDNSFQAGLLIGYSETGKMIGTLPAITEWTPITPNTTSSLLLNELLDYCKRNNIALPL